MSRDWRWASIPKMLMVPLVGLVKSSIELMVVDFPAPFGPRKP